jgi:hypothetical protein
MNILEGVIDRNEKDYGDTTERREESLRRKEK